MTEPRPVRPGLQRVARPHPMAPEAAADPADAAFDGPEVAGVSEPPRAAVPGPSPIPAAPTQVPVPQRAGGRNRPRRGAPAPQPAPDEEPWVPLSTSVRRSVRKRLKAFAVDQERPMQLICDEAITGYLDANGA